MPFLFAPNQKIVFIGDSITDCGRRNEPHQPFGNGYMAMIRNGIIARYPEYNLTFLNHGISGNTIRDLDARWQQDVLDQEPDVLSIKIGINDVWRHIAGRDAEHVPLDEYEATYRRLLELVRKRCETRLVLVDPYVIEADRDDPFRRMLDGYIACVHRLAEAFDAVSVRTQEAFDRALEAQPAAFWARDRIHPGGPGHAVIARAFLKAVGYEF